MPSRGVMIRRVLATAAAACLLLPASGWTWGGTTHHYIAQHYSMHLPPTMDGLSVYDSEVDQKVTDPDSRRSSTPGEAPRHYIDIDVYPEFLAGTLPHDRATLEAEYGVAAVTDNGILPWAVGEVVATLTQQFQNEQWTSVATTIADLCHYVGDSTQPLHCTENYNGQLTDNYGIHSRYESNMMSSHIGDLITTPTAVTYFPDAVEAMFDIIDVSWGDVNTVLQGDNDGRAASGGSYNATYYAALWADTEMMTRERVNAATVATASFVYTAWVDAGRPPVPGSSASVEPSSIAGPFLNAGPSPFREALTIRYAGDGPLTLDVFDARGARVERVVDHASGAGTLTWRPAGRVPSGLYFIRLNGPQVSIVKRVARIE